LALSASVDEGRALPRPRVSSKRVLSLLFYVALLPIAFFVPADVAAIYRINMQTDLAVRLVVTRDRLETIARALLAYRNTVGQFPGEDGDLSESFLGDFAAGETLNVPGSQQQYRYIRLGPDPVRRFLVIDPTTYPSAALASAAREDGSSVCAQSCTHVGVEYSDGEPGGSWPQIVGLVGDQP
jgi:type II secretory pathway pseudopilin PulG